MLAENYFDEIDVIDFCWIRYHRFKQIYNFGSNEEKTSEEKS